MNHKVLWLCLLMLSSAASAHAEHRVALLIDNGQHRTEALATPAKDLDQLAKQLQEFGFRCETAVALDEKQLKSTVEAFANSTPTLGTALVYFSGQALLGGY